MRGWLVNCCCVDWSSLLNYYFIDVRVAHIKRNYHSFNVLLFGRWGLLLHRHHLHCSNESDCGTKEW